MKIRYLIDENLSPRLKIALLSRDPTIDVLRIGDPNVPPLGTLDPDILNYLELSQRLLVTDNRNSIPGHLEEFWATGGQIWGLFWIRPSASLGEIAYVLYVIWETSEAEEWINVIDWIPF